MPYSKEEFLEAVRIAEQVVKRETRNGILSKLNAPQSVMDSGRELQGDAMGDLLNNPLAEKLLPQARIILAQRQVRESAIEATAFGKLKEVVDRVNAVLETGLPITDIAIDGDEETKGDWHGFLEAMEQGDKKEIIFTLQGLLCGIHADLLFTDLPDVEDQYEEIPD